jgi:hypothetical protein
MKRLPFLLLALCALAILAEPACACDRGRGGSTVYYQASPTYYPARVYTPAMRYVFPQSESYYLDPNVTESRYASPDESEYYIMPGPTYYYPRVVRPAFSDDQPNDNWN